jgi:very-short-patch-repair endonuclease
MTNDEKAKRCWRVAAATQIRARQLRQEQTSAEAKLWQYLRDHRLDGFKIRRQHPIGRFVVDFCCVERRLIVEIDVSAHFDQGERDIARTEALQFAGYTVIRYSNDDIEQRNDTVLHDLRCALLSNGDSSKPFD